MLHDLVVQCFLKDELDILSELGTAVLDMSAEELIAKYQEHDLEFGRFWGPHLVTRTEDMTPEERALFIDIAYDVYDTVRSISYHKQGSIIIPQVKPESRFRRDLRFNDCNFEMLEGALRSEYIPHNKPSWKPWSEGKFYELETVADCVEYIRKNKFPLDPQ